MTRNCINRVLQHFDEVEEDEFQLNTEINMYWAEYYLNKLNKRVERALEGEELGGMVESDLEGLEVDDQFENLRQRVESGSELGEDDAAFEKRFLRKFKDNFKQRFKIGMFNIKKAGPKTPEAADQDADEEEDDDDEETVSPIRADGTSDQPRKFKGNVFVSTQANIVELQVVPK